MQNRSISQITRDTKPLPRFRGWEIVKVYEQNYKPDILWEPFAVTPTALAVNNIIWLRKEKWD